MALAISALAGPAMAQLSATPTLSKPGPMPDSIPKLGEPDTVCFLGSTMAAAAAAYGVKDAPAERREGVMELAWRQMAFYIGKVSAKYPEPQAGEQVTAVSGKFMAKANTANQTAIMKWCLGTYAGEVNAYQARLDAARKLTNKGSGAKLAAISVDMLDDDALCFALVGIALPQTMEAAKSNPQAARGVQLLGRAQHFYMGRLLAKPHKVSIEQSIADAWDYTATLSAAKDVQTGHAKVTACVDRFGQISPGFFRAAEKGLPKDS